MNSLIRGLMMVLCCALVAPAEAGQPPDASEQPAELFVRYRLTSLDGTYARPWQHLHVGPNWTVRHFAVPRAGIRR